MATPYVTAPAPAIAAQRPAIVGGRSIDRWLAGAVLILLGLGILMVFDASFFIGERRYGNAYALIRRHVSFVVAAAGIAIAMLRVDLHRLRRFAVPALGVGIFLLVLVLIPGIGQVRGGARRWLPAMLFSFEPSELVKPIFVLYLAHSLTRKRERIESFTHGVLPHLLVLAVPVLLLLKEPDFGAAMVLVVVTLAMLFAAGARGVHLAGMVGAVLPAAAALVVLSPYRWKRLVAFLDPWADPRTIGFQLVQSLLSLGSGGWLGVGLGNGNQKLFYLPEGHTDFIFALIGEELGLAGAILVLACVATIAVRGFRIANRLADPFACLLAFGLTFLLVTQAAMNIGVVVGLLPTKGLPLPFVSYGGSSLLAAGTTVAVLLGLSREAR
jgi:cell division protein FtsW